MSTYDDRPNRSGGKSDEGLFYPNTRGSAGATYSASGRDPAEEAFEPYATSDRTSVMSTRAAGSTESGYTATDSGFGTESGFGEPGFDEYREPLGWHGGVDFGLVVLRIVVGGTFILHGLQHLFGMFHGVGIHGFAKFLSTSGYQYTNIMAWVAGGTELGGGALLILGLFTPLAAGALIGLMANVIALKLHIGFFSPGYELELALAGGAFALLFAGPGRVSLDRPTPWYRHPVMNGWIFLIVGGLAAAATLLVVKHR